MTPESIKEEIISEFLRIGNEDAYQWRCPTRALDHLKKSLDRYAKANEDFRLNQLTGWIDENVGTSSTAIFLYMAAGRIPEVFEAPSDESDRGRCISLLNAVPDWIPRLKEIEFLNIEGTCNGEKVKPWNEQIPMILSEMRSNVNK